MENAEGLRAGLISYLATTDGEISRELASCAVRALGNPDVTADAFQSEWQTLACRLAQIEGLADDLATIDLVCSNITLSCAPKWAEALRSTPADGIEDPLTPGDWSKRWQLKRLATWLGRIDRHARLQQLGAERVEREKQLKSAYEQSIAHGFRKA